MVVRRQIVASFEIKLTQWVFSLSGGRGDLNSKNSFFSGLAAASSKKTRGLETLTLLLPKVLNSVIEWNRKMMSLLLSSTANKKDSINNLMKLVAQSKRLLALIFSKL